MSNSEDMRPATPTYNAGRQPLPDRNAKIHEVDSIPMVPDLASPIGSHHPAAAGSSMSPPRSTHIQVAPMVPNVEKQDSFATTLFKTVSRRPSAGQALSRVIEINDPIKNAAKRFLHNNVSTAKYSVISFVPKFLLEQFSKYANVFFLVTAALQQIPGVTPTNKYDTIAPLSFVLFFSALKEIAEDLHRHKNDREVNLRHVDVLSGSVWVKKLWRDVQVGDVVWVLDKQSFPADLALLASSEPDGICYIETANLDGETNLKIRQARHETAHYTSASKVADMSGCIESEQPNSSLYTYDGTLKFCSKSAPGPTEVVPLDPKQILLRGARLRNTGWIYGIVVFTGHETKLMRNTSAAPIKTTSIERATNRQILVLCGILILMSILSSVGLLVLSDELVNQTWYLALVDLPINLEVLSFLKNTATFFILYNNLIPISLIVTIEMVKYINAALISHDLNLYYEPADMPANVRTSSLVDELAQVNYIFSDKTGTLTCNVMEFREFCVGGVMYREDGALSLNDNNAGSGDAAPITTRSFSAAQDSLRRLYAAETDPAHDYEEARMLDSFMTLLAVCHTVIPEYDSANPNEAIYQGSSPDEVALVKGARQFGITFVNRKPTSVSVDLSRLQPPGSMTSSRPLLADYEVLAINEFNSTRKRMSVVLRRDNQYMLFVKGAETVIFPRLSDESRTRHQAATMQALEAYATTGLRTLCFAVRMLTETEYTTWKRDYDLASTTLVNRSDELDRVAELIEVELSLLGATAIEDKLQDGVPETIYDLAQANIKIWVLTGDRQETAINVGYACRLLLPEMQVLVINEPTSALAEAVIKKHLQSIKDSATQQRISLVIDGTSLGFALTPPLSELFLQLAVECACVICCRVSPLQKSLVVKLVKAYQGSITLAIGDGANDVPMIQAAHIGIGISGMEGLQAARSSDIAIGQFRYLKRLLLVHGAWAYHRLIRLILYSFYKNVTLYMTEFWFAIYSGFSGEPMYEPWILSAFNVFFTSVPPLALGIFEKVLDESYLLGYPALYRIHQSGNMFDIRTFWTWLLNAVVHSLLIFYGVMYFLGTQDPNAPYIGDYVSPKGYNLGLWLAGCVMYTTTILTVLMKVALVTSFWARPWTYVAIIGSLALWTLFLPVYSIVGNQVLGMSPELLGAEMLYLDPRYWLVCVLVSSAIISVDYAARAMTRYVRPTDIEIFQELGKLKKSPSSGVEGGLVGRENQSKARSSMPRHSRSDSTNSPETRMTSFAFTQSRGQREVMQKADSDWHRPTGQ
ncbi:hypothetical protein RI367_007572 [Sorochytrium milnesiophthora]